MRHAIFCLAFVSILCGTALSYAAEPWVVQGQNLKPKQPQLGVGPDKSVHLVFGSGSAVYHCVSADAGKSFSEPMPVGEIKFLSLGMRRGPRVAATQNAVIVTAIGGELGGGRDGDLSAWRSVDHGKTWSKPARVNDVDASAREGLQAMAAGPKGELYCVWLDLRNNRTEIMGSRSDDGGKTWNKNVLVYRSPDGSVCECCHPSVTFSVDGKLAVMWRNSLAGNRDMFVATSSDNGNTFTDAIRLGEDSWELDGCPMDGGAIAVDSEGNIHATWRRKKAVYLTQTDIANKLHLNDERLLGSGEQPWIALSQLGPVTAWITGRPGDLMMMRPKNDKPIRIADAARDPVVVCLDELAIIAWEADAAGRAVIKVDRRELK